MKLYYGLDLGFSEEICVLVEVSLSSFQCTAREIYISFIFYACGASGSKDSGCSLVRLAKKLAANSLGCVGNFLLQVEVGGDYIGNSCYAGNSCYVGLDDSRGASIMMFSYFGVSGFSIFYYALLIVQTSKS